MKKILKAFKKEFACNGTIVDDEELGQVIQLQGDQRFKIQEFLIVEVSIWISLKIMIIFNVFIGCTKSYY